MIAIDLNESYEAGIIRTCLIGIMVSVYFVVYYEIIKQTIVVMLRIVGDVMQDCPVRIWSESIERCLPHRAPSSVTQEATTLGHTRTLQHRYPEITPYNPPTGSKI